MIASSATTVAAAPPAAIYRLARPALVQPYDVLALANGHLEITVLATGLGYSGVTLPAAGGGVFFSEFGRNRISRIWPDGHVTKVADVFQAGAIAFDSLHRIVGVTQNGTLFRIERNRGKTIYS